MLELSMALQWYCRKNAREHGDRVLFASLASQVSAAVFKSEESYDRIQDSVHALLERVKSLQYLGTSVEGGKSAGKKSWVPDLLEFWKSYFGEMPGD